MTQPIRESIFSPLPKGERITRITVNDFKSIYQEQSIEIKPLTILAGANSSGKSSIMQPLLLLKQTLESTYDPGALLLNGPNIKFTQIDQLLPRAIDKKTTSDFYTGVKVEPEQEGSGIELTTHFIQSKQNSNYFKKNWMG